MADAQQQELALLDSDIEALEGVFVTLLQLANFSWSKRPLKKAQNYRAFLSTQLQESTKRVR
ncbi:hypothetical protein [Pseudomonas silesiensis]|uniref:hypothetical protein n=1 Tax=Pseudomonas silesiensis TaxID=1853130 RepID=UPI0030DC51C2